MTKKTMMATVACVSVLREAGEPLSAKVIAERVMMGYETGLKGKTPAATIAAHLYTQAKKGQTFRKTARGMFELLPETDKTAPLEAVVDPAVTPNTVVVRRGVDVKPDPRPEAKRRTGRTRQIAAV